MASDGQQQTLDAIHEFRRTSYQNGYRPLEVYSPGALARDGKPIPSAGKRPVGRKWREQALLNPPAAVVRRVSPQATNTGIVTGELSGLDVDVLNQEITDAIVAMIEATLGPTPLSRIGRAPKILLCYRAEQPFAKLSTPKYRLPDGTEAQLEILGDGQQFVAAGIHPDTGQPFEWPDRSPLDVPLAALPTISIMQARDIVGHATSILIEAGGIIEKPESKSSHGGRSAESGQFFRAVNDAALADIDAWAPSLSFHDRGGNSGWRITSKELGRPLQEDISIHPTGIWDFGEEKPLTAIDVVIAHGGAAEAVQAAMWLCQRLGKDPTSLGWHVKPTPPPSPPGTLPLISIRAGERHIAADQGLEAMKKAGIPFYQRSGELVRVCRIKAKAADKSDILVPGIMPVRLPLLRRALGHAARWERFDRDGNAIATDPSKEIAEQIAEMIDEWPFRALAGVIGCPTLRPDGSLLDQRGYDERTGLVLENSLQMPPIPQRPTKDDAEEARRFLEGLLVEFPFSNDTSKAVGLSQLMTPVVRGALTAAPMHLATAPQAGTGKSYLNDIASMIATGERCPVIALSKSAEENEKRLLGAALSGLPIIGIDNANQRLSGDFLCQVTERPVLLLRALGTSKMYRIDNNFTVFANGNNTGVADDLVRRTITASLDANMEDPETRTFKNDPLAAIRANRGKYVAACLTIALAYITAGKPGRRPPLASYEAWSDFVRSPLVWLGFADPVETISAARIADPVRQARRAVFIAWGATLGTTSRYLTSQIIYEATKYDELRETLLEIAAEPKQINEINSTRLGKWLGRNKDTVIDTVAGRLKLVVDDSDTKRLRWQLITL